MMSSRAPAISPAVSAIKAGGVENNVLGSDCLHRGRAFGLVGRAVESWPMVIAATVPNLKNYVK